jgi:integrase
VSAGSERDPTPSSDPATAPGSYLDDLAPGTTSRSEALPLSNGQRWWVERTERYVAAKSGVDQLWRKRTARVLLNLVLPFGRDHGPSHFERLGFDPPTSARAVTRAMIEALRDTPTLAPTSRQNWTSRLRGFLAFDGNPLATDDDLWKFGKPIPKKRPYLALEKAKAILKAAEGRERLVVALGLFNGLRSVEIHRLKVGDLCLDEQPMTVWILGKGTRGGKARRIALNPLAYGELLQFVKGKRPGDPVYPGTYSTIDKDFRKAQHRAGFEVAVGTHALRRSFGRLSNDAGVGIAQIQAVYGHASPSTTSYYIGVEETRMAAGMDQMARFFEQEA